MIVKFFSTRTGGGTGSVSYLLNERAGQGTAKVLDGDPALTKAIIKGMSQKHKVCMGVLSFEEAPQDLSENEKLKIMKDFEAMLLPQMQGDYNILWVEHSDKHHKDDHERAGKPRLELNFVIPKLNLSTDTALNPYFYKNDFQRVNEWKDCINQEYSLTNPLAHEKRELTSVDKRPHLPPLQLVKNEELNSLLKKLLAQGKNQTELIVELERQNYKITSVRKNGNFSVKTPNQRAGRGAKVNLKEYYEIAENSRRIRGARDSSQELTPNSREHGEVSRRSGSRERLSQLINSKLEYLNRKYRRVQKTQAHSLTGYGASPRASEQYSTMEYHKDGNSNIKPNLQRFRFYIPSLQGSRLPNSRRSRRTVQPTSQQSKSYLQQPRFSLQVRKQGQYLKNLELDKAKCKERGQSLQNNHNTAQKPQELAEQAQALTERTARSLKSRAGEALEAFTSIFKNPAQRKAHEEEKAELALCERIKAEQEEWDREWEAKKQAEKVELARNSKRRLREAKEKIDELVRQAKERAEQERAREQAQERQKEKEELKQQRKDEILAPELVRANKNLEEEKRKKAHEEEQAEQERQAKERADKEQEQARLKELKEKWKAQELKREQATPKKEKVIQKSKDKGRGFGW